MWNFILFIIPFVFILFLYNDCKKPKNFPPGPKWYPIIGSALTVQTERNKVGMLWKAIRNMGVKYKNKGALGFKIGKDRVVVAITVDAIKEMMSNEIMDGRPTGPFYETRTWGMRRGVLLTDGDFWTQQRRFIVRHLKEFGFHRKGMMELIETEAEFILEDFKNLIRTGNGLIQMQDTFSLYILNILWTMMAGKRYNRDDDELKELQKLLHKLFLNIDMMGATFSHFPILQYLAPTYSGYTDFVDIHKIIMRFIKKEVDKHKQTLQLENEPRDLMDVYLQAIQSTEHDEAFTERQLFAICLDMFIAGSETTTKTMDFAFLHIIREPKIQNKLYEEIIRVIGRNRLPRLDDRINMPYCEAIILEALRFFMSNTFGIPHRALQNTTLQGYNIPKDTMLIASFHGVMLDETMFKNPHVFDPERFLCDGKITIPDRFIPFGVGKHRCMGELMAKSNLFLFITTLVQNFHFLIPDGHPKPSDIPLDGATPSVRKYVSKVVLR